MAKYNVTLYYHTYIEVEVEAKSEEEAIEDAYCEAGKPQYDAQALHNITAAGMPEVEEVEYED